MNSPFIFQPSCFFIRHRKMSMLYSMCQLKNNTNGNPGNNRKNKEPNQPTGKPHSINGQCHKQKKIYDLKAPEYNVIFCTHLLQRHYANALFKIFLIV